MRALVTPPRLRGVEILDGRGIDPNVVRRSLSDVAMANALFGGARAVLEELKLVLGELPCEATLLDVGTGMGDIPAKAWEAASAHGKRLTTFGLDMAETLVLESRSRIGAVVCANALELPFADRSVDVVTCSQTLHHFADPQARVVLRELDRVARVRVIVSDLRRSWLAAGGLWLASFPLGFHPVSRHDGVVSVMRGFTGAELSAVVQSAIGSMPTVRRRVGFRLTATWRPATHSAGTASTQ